MYSRSQGIAAAVRPPRALIQYAFNLTRMLNYSFTVFPELLQNNAHAVLSIFPYSPPICVVDLLDSLLEAPVPPVLCHLRQSYGGFPICWLWLWLLGLVEIGEDLALLT